MIHYTITVDGGCRGNGTPDAQSYGSALIETACGKSRHIFFDELTGAQTNNEAEYAALTKALEYVAGKIVDAKRPVGNYNIEIVMDSALVLNQLFGTWKCKAPNLIVYLFAAGTRLKRFGAVTHRKISGDEMKAIVGH